MTECYDEIGHQLKYRSDGEQLSVCNCGVTISDAETHKSREYTWYQLLQMHKILSSIPVDEQKRLLRLYSGIE